MMLPVGALLAQGLPLLRAMSEEQLAELLRTCAANVAAAQLSDDDKVRVYALVERLRVELGAALKLTPQGEPISERAAAALVELAEHDAELRGVTL